MCAVGLFISHQVSVGLWVYIWSLSSIPLFSMFLFYASTMLIIYYNSVVSLEVRNGDTNSSSFIVQHLQSLCSCVNFKIFFLFSFELYWNFDGDYIESAH